jgi:hypothetical protein
MMELPAILYHSAKVKCLRLENHQQVGHNTKHHIVDWALMLRPHVDISD